jgi:hypothetical protein
MIADQGVNCLGSQAAWITLSPQGEIDDLLGDQLGHDVSPVGQSKVPKRGLEDGQ